MVVYVGLDSFTGMGGKVAGVGENVAIYTLYKYWYIVTATSSDGATPMWLSLN